MLLSSLLPHLDPIHVNGSIDRTIRRVTHDSRNAESGDLFVAIRGERVDARRFVPELSVAAVIADDEVEALPGVTVIQVRDARCALAQAASVLAGQPGAAIPVVGITGTNGKTTVTWMLESIAIAAGDQAGVIGTTGHRVAGSSVVAAHTTPEAPVIQALLAEMRDAQCALVAMEVSSIGIAMRRADGIPFQVGVFTSFGRDHLDFHADMDDYFTAKARLFEVMLSPEGVAILNADEPVCARIDTHGRTTWTTGLGEDATHRAVDLESTVNGTTFTIRSPDGEQRISLPLLGVHNVRNATSAFAAARALGYSPTVCAAGLGNLDTIPGRLEAVPNGHGITVLVDYAHTPDALAQVLASLQGLGAGRILTVFGCGGDRDPGKRPQMGAAASNGSDKIFVTSDNPRSEDPDAIITEILTGVSGDHTVIPDRAAAIARAISEASAGDIVLIAGKGHEQTQTVGTRVLPFDDRAVAAAALEAVS